MQEVFEIWKDVPGYEGFYQASNKGNVRSVDRYIECRGTMRMQKGKMLKPHIGKFGYKQVILYNKKPKLFKVHRLVAMLLFQIQKTFRKLIIKMKTKQTTMLKIWNGALAYIT